MKIIVITVVALSSVAAFAQSPAREIAPVKDAQTTASMTDGEIRKIDKETGKITIKHGPIRNLEMPSMTMVFRVKEPAMLDQVKPGDKIKFIADDINGALTVVRLESAR